MGVAMRPFLTARWKNLILLTWEVPPRLLEHRLPRGVELDLRDGKAFVSLVGFDFLDTRVLGVAWPGYRQFPEVNLRFYVRHGKQRGVMFIREFVPQLATVLIARAVYNEPYARADMNRRRRAVGDSLSLEHRLRVAGREHRFGVTAERRSSMPGEDSVEHFFKEHQWGFGRSRSGELIRYEVRHPWWRVHRVLSHELDVDFARLYGGEFGFLSEHAPFSCVLAVGSEVAVYPHGTL